MSKDAHAQRLESVLNQAKEREKKYDWLKAAELYKQALSAAGKKDFLRRGEVQERLGFCLCRAAFQAEMNEDFKKRMQLAAEAYEHGAELLERVEAGEARGEVNHCRAVAAYANSWITSDASRKKELLDDCWMLEKKAIKAYEEADDQANTGRLCNSLMACLVDRLDVEWDAESREKIVDEALGYGEKAIEIFSRSEDKRQLAHAYTLTAFFCENAAFGRGFKAERREEYRKRALRYPEKAVEISKEIGDAYLVALSNFRLADAYLDIMGSSGLPERPHFEKALEGGILAKDNLLIADALWGLEFGTVRSARMQEDPDKAREEYRKLDEYCEDAIRHYRIIGYDAGIAFAYSYAIAPIETRSGMETSLESKRLLIEKHVKLGYKGLQHARLSGSMGRTFHMKNTLATVLVCLARVETDTGRKRALLEESSRYIEEVGSILEQASACAFVEPREGNLAVRTWFLAQNQAELATIEETVEAKTQMLKKAVTTAQSAWEYWVKWLKSPWARVEKVHLLTSGQSAVKAGKMLNQLYALTGDLNVLGDAIDRFEKSVEYYRKADSPSSLVAASYWQIAQAYDRMGNHTGSAESFELASENYMLAAKKIPQLKGFYQDHAAYMRAWSEIERARHHHAAGRYGEAKEHYQKSADLHKSTTRWSHLYMNYLAWAQLEEAEDLSRRERTEEARSLFQQAAELFGEARKSIQARLEKSESTDERESLLNLAKASDIRREYSLGRIALEEAKILDRKGDHVASSKSYRSAAEIFQKIAKAESEQSRRELQPIIYICQAWERMMMAEAKASSTMYGEAAELFEQAKEHTLDQPTSLLAFANSSFCKALEAGTQFETTRNATLHLAATQHLESAAKYYLKAGFKTASEYAKATQRLFDAYTYMHKTKTETDPKKKTQYYQMAEKLLEASAGSYMKAKHPEKSEEVQRLLESVKEERQLAVSLTEVLHVPAITSTTTSFSTPSPTHEQAVGLERFEHADIQANLLLRVGEVTVGQDVDFRLELVNAGKAPALLIKVDEVMPEGFEIKEVSESYAVEDRYLNMKGRRLNPLKTEDVRITVRPRFKGTYVVKPRVLYIDEAGKYKSHEPEPVTLTVKELGIKGWIKGER